jgi:hypothetical protein
MVMIGKSSKSARAMIAGDRDADIGLLQGGGIVDAIAGHEGT